jgi:hypothetical protein
VTAISLGPACIGRAIARLMLRRHCPTYERVAGYDKAYSTLALDHAATLDTLKQATADIRALNAQLEAAYQALDPPRPFSGRRTHYGDPLTAITAMTHEEKAQTQARASYGLPVTSNGTTMLRNPAPHNDAAAHGLAHLSGSGTLSVSDLRQAADEALAMAMRMTW